MTDINRQKFLAELGKLLTFMYEEDLRAALAMYNRLFADAKDEQALLQFLVSPTRQAVLLARAYDAKERKLQVHAQSKEVYDNEGELPEFIQAINRLRDEAVDRGLVCRSVPENQMSMFDGSDDLTAQQAISLLTAEVPAAASDLSAPEADGISPEKAVADFMETMDRIRDKAMSGYNAGSPAAEAMDRSAAVTDGVVPEEASANHVADFMENFAIADNELFNSENKTDEVAAPPESAFGIQPAAAAPENKTKTEKKTCVGLLILYLIFAIPLGILGVVLLLIPTLLFLGLGVGVVSLGIFALTSAFGGFAVFADIMVVLGSAIAILALGLLILWTFVWFLGGAIPALIRGLILLGKKWCTKEVAA